MSASTPTHGQGGERAPENPAANLRRAFFKGIIIPACVLIFFTIAPAWLNYRIHSGITDRINESGQLSAEVKSQRLAEFSRIDFAEVCGGKSPEEFKALREDLEKAGMCDRFLRLRWSWYLSLALMTILLASMGGTLLLNRSARESRDQLIRSYRIGWRMGMTAALLKVFLLVPLLSYGLYELSTLAADKYYPQLILGVVIGGVVVLWQSLAILLKKVPLEFPEAMAREVRPAEAPELWSAVKAAAARLQTAPPDHILIGMQLNFYVTELAVNYEGGRAEGRTLFLSQPLLKQLPPDEILSIIGHELGHFRGEDTRITREFYPMRFKANATMAALARSGGIGWTSVHALNFFHWCFGTTEQAMSRERELLADRVGAELTSATVIAQALVKFQIVTEAFQASLAGTAGELGRNPFDLPLVAFVREQFAGRPAFWTQLFEKKTPHPLDSHPTLSVRLESLGQSIGPTDAMALAAVETETAYVRWFSGRDALFAPIVAQADAAVSRFRSRTQIAQADTQTEAGRKLLETHFPEVRWTVRPLTFWSSIIFCGAASVGSLLMAAFVDLPGLQVTFGLCCVLIGAWTVLVWRRHRHGQFCLRADSLSYTGWRRPLVFAEVVSLHALRSNGSITLTFRQKVREPAIWKFGLLRFRQKKVSLALAWVNGKQHEVLQVIHRYFTRQIP